MLKTKHVVRALVMILAVLPSACASKFYSPVQPAAAQLSCSSGESPVAQRYYDGRFEWVCGHSPCSGDRETVWKPVNGSEDRHGIQRVSSSCLGHCDSGKARFQDGTCPGHYTVKSKFDANTLVVVAEIDDKPIQGVSIAFGDRRLSGVSGMTDAKGEARFDVTTDPFRQVVEEDSKRLGTENWMLSGTFKDGKVERQLFTSGHDSNIAKEARQNSFDRGRSAQEALKRECSGGNGESCFKLGQGNGGGANNPYYRQACDLKFEEACALLKTYAEAKRFDEANAAPPAQANLGRKGTPFTGRTASSPNGQYRQLITVPAKSSVTATVATKENGTWASPLLLRCQFVHADLSGRVDLQVGNPCVTSVSNNGPLAAKIELDVDACDGIEDQGNYGKRCRPVRRAIEFAGTIEVK